MAVDRGARAALAEAIAAFMKGQTSASSLDERLAEARAPTEDEAVHALADAVWFLYDDLEDHTISASRQDWDFLRRCIAFLESDLEQPAPETPRLSRWLGLAVAVGFVSCVALLGAGIQWLWWGLVVPWLLIGFAEWLLALGASACERGRTASTLGYAPFHSAAEWRAHEHTLASYDLPAYDPAKHAKGIDSPVVAMVMEFPWWLIAWPVLVVRALLSRRGSVGDATS